MRGRRVARVALGVLVVVAVLLGLAVRGDRPAEAVEARLGKAPSKFLVVDGLRTHYRDRGSRTRRARAERFHAGIAGSRLVVLDGLGHVPMEEDPARTVAVVREFLGAGDPAIGSSAAAAPR